MKKKLVLFLLIVSVFCTVFSGCGNNNSDTDTTTTTPANVAQPETTESTLPTVFTSINLDELTYPQYNAMSAEQQQAVVESFDSLGDFFEWHDQAKKDHEEFQEFINQGSTNEGTEPTVDENTETTAPDVTDPAPDVTDPTPDVTDPAADDVTFMEYQAMSGNEQRRFMMSFPSVDAFMQWHAKAVQEYKDNMKEWGSDNTPTDPTIEIEG